MVEEMTRLADKWRVDLIVTTGSTGIGPRDFAPEATRTIIDREVPGIAETIRKHGQDRLPMSMLSRSVAGLRGTTLIINLPGSVKGVEEGMDAVMTGIFHWYAMVRGGGH
jgi:molybdenum cofactor synthesis domain-containing protein